MSIARGTARIGFIVLSAVAYPAFGRAAGAAAPTCAAAAAAAERRYNLPAGLLLAIGKVESGAPDPRTHAIEPWPWSVNAQGQSLSFPSKAAAIVSVDALRAGGESVIDVGCFQINLHFHPDAFADLDAAFDPARNADVAARFLIDLHNQFGDWGQATGAYHSQTVSLAGPYRREVASAIGDEPPAAPPPDPTMALLRGAWRATLPSIDRPAGLVPVSARAVPPSPAMLLHLPAGSADRSPPPTSLRDIIWRQH